MTTNTILILFAIILFLDLFLTLIRYSLVNAHLPRLLNLREGKEELVDRTIKTIERPRIRVSLRVTQGIVHFFFGGMVVIISLAILFTPTPSWHGLLIVLGVGIILIFGEALFERLALVNPDTWSLRISGFGKLVDILCSPFDRSSGEIFRAGKYHHAAVYTTDG